MIETTVPTHAEMANALRSTATLLLEANILSPQGSDTINSAANRLYNKPGKAWSYATPSAQPVLFELCVDRAGRQFIPKLGVASIEVRDEIDDIPFVSWDINLLLEYADQEVHCPRWHFDLCNPEQAGPITHLQYGGNKHLNLPNLDVRVREPRWNAAPLDLILMCETIAASFYQDTWESQLRDLTRWNEIIQQSQRLCFPYYLRGLYNTLNAAAAGSHLSACWNSNCN
ncbi:hypothetical protein BA950_09270 [Erythrobacter sp. SAORIC-644]|uniref:hypothetical protein n=1 Tax=Erythrobacter sp. SAORIC-644 TaxID=1869314 RepID=UPI000C9FD44F|nr:hypothetical protein [Erythrobacter sp. SAORIC-644]PNQ76001.1 hypothetical protein BA950_09270 [Erythrobacter sp. SAORIC-644]